MVYWKGLRDAAHLHGVRSHHREEAAVDQYHRDKEHKARKKRSPHFKVKAKSSELNTKALIIQRRWREKAGNRKREEEWRKQATEALHRQHHHKRPTYTLKFSRAKKVACAITVQSCWRGFVARKELWAKRTEVLKVACAIKVQASFRGHQARVEVHVMVDAADELEVDVYNAFRAALAAQRYEQGSRMIRPKVPRSALEAKARIIQSSFRHSKIERERAWHACAVERLLKAEASVRDLSDGSEALTKAKPYHHVKAEEAASPSRPGMLRRTGSHKRQLGESPQPSPRHPPRSTVPGKGGLKGALKGALKGKKGGKASSLRDPSSPSSGKRATFAALVGAGTSAAAAKGGKPQLTISVPPITPPAHDAEEEGEEGWLTPEPLTPRTWAVMKIQSVSRGNSDRQVARERYETVKYVRDELEVEGYQSFMSDRHNSRMMSNIAETRKHSAQPVYVRPAQHVSLVFYAKVIQQWVRRSKRAAARVRAINEAVEDAALRGEKVFKLKASASRDHAKPMPGQEDPPAMDPAPHGERSQTAPRRVPKKRKGGAQGSSRRGPPPPPCSIKYRPAVQRCSTAEDVFMSADPECTGEIPARSLPWLFARLLPPTSESMVDMLMPGVLDEQVSEPSGGVAAAVRTYLDQRLGAAADTAMIDFDEFITLYNEFVLPRAPAYHQDPTLSPSAGVGATVTFQTARGPMAVLLSTPQPPLAFPPSPPQHPAGSRPSTAPNRRAVRTAPAADGRPGTGRPGSRAGRAAHSNAYPDYSANPASVHGVPPAETGSPIAYSVLSTPLSRRFGGPGTGFEYESPPGTQPPRGARSVGSASMHVPA